MLELNKIHNDDCLNFMKDNIPDNYVDLIVTSPPYDNIRDYKKGEWRLDLPAIGQEISRILKDGGICAMVIQDQTKDGRKSLTSFKTIVNWCENTKLDLWECCLYYRSGTPGAWWNKRFRVDHEYIPIFIKGKRPQYFNKEHMKVENPSYGITKKSTYRKTNGDTIGFTHSENTKKCCGTVIHYKNSSRETPKAGEIGSFKLQHPATFPDKLAADFIQAFTQEEMIVFDPFMGSGTVARMANELNRKWIGCEINSKYIDEIALQMINV
jgi:DNA modification methylase